ncbi:MAG: alpha/beta hydrolase [Blautia sp.]
MNKTIKNIMIGAGIVAGTVTTAGVISYKITKKLVGIALDRKEETTIDSPERKRPETSEMKAFIKMREEAAHKLEQSSCETVNIIARDGVNLVGHWQKGKNVKRIIIAVHGWRSSWTKDFGLIADFLHENNCHVLYIEQRGQNNSGGKYMGFGLTERYDCLDWIDWVNQKEPEKLPIYLCGISMGASTVLMTAGFDLLQEVHGVIADCGYTSPHAIWKHVAEEELHLRYDEVMSSIAEDICKSKIQIGPKDYSCTDAMEKCKVPVLFVHGTDDDFVPVEMTYENYKACVAPKRLLVVPGAGHGMSYIVEKEKYEETLRKFWNEFD